MRLEAINSHEREIWDENVKGLGANVWDDDGEGGAD